MNRYYVKCPKCRKEMIRTNLMLACRRCKHPTMEVVGQVGQMAKPAPIYPVITRGLEAVWR